MEPDGTTIAAGAGDGSVTFWTIATGRTITGTACTGAVMSIAFSPDSTTVATSDRDQLEKFGNPRATVRLWDVATGTNILLSARPAGTGGERGFRGYGYGLAFHPSGEQLICSGDGNGSLEIWDLATRRKTELLRRHDMSILALALSQDGRTLVTGGMDYTIRLWDVATWRHIATATPQDDQLREVSFHPDGHIVASSSGDHTIRLWHVPTAEPAAILYGHTRYVDKHAFSPDGHVLVSGSADGTVRLWQLD
jgi:WD40 repeat protein